MLVSVIIPTLNEAQNVAAALQAARRDYSPAQVELVVADGGSDDDTLALISPGVTVVQAPRGRARQMNAGAAASHGQVLVFCHADSRLPVGWREAVLTALADPHISGGTFQTLILPAHDLILKARNHLCFRARWPIMFGDQCQFMRRADFERVGGFPDLVLMEDIELSHALHGLGKLVRLPLRVVTSARRFQELGTLRQISLNARCQFGYRWLGWSPERVAQLYRSSRERRAAHG